MTGPPPGVEFVEHDGLGSNPPDATACPRPTHRLKGIKVGHNGVQMLVSTKDHVYEAEDVVGGEHSWQVIGSWEEASVTELSVMFTERQKVTANGSAATGSATGFKGSGQKLGASGYATEHQ